MSCCRRNRRCPCRNNMENPWRNSFGENRNSCYSNNRCNQNSNCACRCNCKNEMGFPENYMLAHAYTPNQGLDRTFTPEVALQNGTLFPELVSPYYPGQSMEIIEYLKNDDRNGGCGCE